MKMGWYGLRLFEETVEQKVIYTGKIITVRTDTARLEDGRTALREVVEHPGGVCVLPLEEDGRTYLVRQFRYPFSAVTRELPAGKLDGPEAHLPAARRELSEEIGVEAQEMIYLGYVLASPGFCTEVLHMYLARGLRHGKQHLDEGEFLDVEKIPFAQLVEQVMSGEIVDAKTVAITLKVQEFLRREAGGAI